MFCSQCGKELNADAKFCYNCGAKVSIIPEEQQIKQPDEEVIQPKKEIVTPPTEVQVETKKDDLSCIDDGIDAKTAQGARDGDISSMLYVAKAYLRGIRVIISTEKAKYWYKKVLELDGNSIEAINGLADIILYNEEYDGHVGEALELYKKSEALGSLRAMEGIAEIYLFGSEGADVDKDIDKSIDYCERAAKKGSIRCLNSLYKLYCEKYDKDFADVEYVEFLRGEASKGNIQACCCLFDCYTDEEIVPKDERTAKHFLDMAVEKNLPRAICKLAYIYGTGDLSIIPQNIDKANELWEKAAQLNEPWALQILADLYFQGEDGYPENMEKTLEYSNKCLEYDDYELYCTDVYFYLGYIYGTDDGVTPFDNKMSFMYLKASADAGDDIAQHTVANNYVYGIGVEKNIDKACEYYEMSIEQDNPKAMCKYAELFDGGVFVERNAKKAVELYSKAAELGSIEAKEQLGIFYYKGEVLGEDKKKARELFEECAKEGLPQSKYNFAMMQQNGEGGPKILKAAEYWYKSLLNDNDKLFNDDCKWNLALIYGELKNYPEAFCLFEELSRKEGYENRAVAMYNLGLFYANGWYVNQSDASAKSWFIMAANNGCKEAADLLREIGEDAPIPPMPVEPPIGGGGGGNGGGGKTPPPNISILDVKAAKKILIFTSLFFIIGFLLSMLLSQEFLLSLLVGYLVSVIPLSISRLKGLRLNAKSNAIAAGTIGYAVTKGQNGCAVATGFLIGKWLVNYAICAVALIYWVIKSIVILIRYYGN